jgi:hypothetical protein
MPHAGPSLEKPVQLSKLLEVGLKDRPGEPALVSLEGAWSWSELERLTAIGTIRKRPPRSFVTGGSTLATS